MRTRQMPSDHSPSVFQAHTALLTVGFWFLTLTLIVHQLLVVLPAYRGGLLTAYTAGRPMKDIAFPVPIYTPYTLVPTLLFFPVFLLIVFIAWIAPVITIVWGVFLGKSWRQIPTRTKWGWVATLLLLWSLTLLTRTAAWALLKWLLD